MDDRLKLLMQIYVLPRSPWVHHIYLQIEQRCSAQLYLHSRLADFTLLRVAGLQAAGLWVAGSRARWRRSKSWERDIVAATITAWMLAFWTSVSGVLTFWISILGFLPPGLSPLGLWLPSDCWSSCRGALGRGSVGCGVMACGGLRCESLGRGRLGRVCIRRMTLTLWWASTALGQIKENQA